MAPTYEDTLATGAAKSLRIGGRQAQIKATVGSVVLQMMNLRAIPRSENPISAPSLTNSSTAKEVTHF